MNVTRDVIIDLWPLYQSGEASGDTRRLVEDFLESDPDFMRQAREASEPWLEKDRVPPPVPDEELKTLHQAKRLVRLREALFWIAIFLSVAPLTVYDTSWGKGWVIRDHPWLAGSLALAAAVSWGLYLGLRRRLRVTGL